MTLARVVQPEILDELAPDDPRARRSREDLRRVHAAMFSTRALLGGWHALVPADAPALRVLDLGAGDGRVLLPLARRLGSASLGSSGCPGGPRVALTLLDRQDLLSEDTRAAFAACGWTVTHRTVDVLDWADASDEARVDLIVASLFLHHFEGAALDRLLAAIAARADRCLVFEPRRSRLALAGARLIGALGVNAVTRHDALASVRAGFDGEELGARWPRGSAAGTWQLEESAVMPFGHRLLARRTA